ncbi:MAG: DNA mismatch repair endonuclease MutL [Acidobacteria bacterium]|nr:DNA mismatch repair endonuclease MutL [Acidobacteriota bacterium]
MPETTRIRILPDLLASKIAAGEVVERPSSVVKELLENSLDAGASRIRVEILAGGKRSIRIADDGEGMSRDDALLALERHATSKIRTVDDLEAIQTLGFRGEALPSIASVSRLTVRTLTAEGMAGTEVEVEGGRIREVRECAWSRGTEVHVRDLFFNVPARRKFLKSESTELFHITNLVTHYALAYPAVSLELVHGDRTLLAVTPVESLRERAFQLFGGDFLAGLVEVNLETGELSVHGFVSKPSAARTTRESQYFFVNGRFVRDRILSRALAESYRAVLPSGLYPAAIVFLNLPATDVDVNVHPAKTEVRFRSAGSVKSVVEAAVRSAMSASTPVTELRAGGPRSYLGVGGLQVRVTPRHPPTASAFQLQAPLSTPERPPVQTPLGLQFNRSIPPPAVPPAAQAAPRLRGARADMCSARSAATGAFFPGPIPTEELEHLRPLGQIRDSFIVASTAGGLLIVDQHVAHERILFEQFRASVRQQPAPSQPLLIPEPIALGPAQIAAFEGCREELAGMGIDAEILSGGTMVIKALPAEVDPSDARSLVLEVLEIAEEGSRSMSVDALRDRLTASLACQAAIKINMPLTEEKMAWLLERLFQTECPTNCPHGRPIALHLTLAEIEKLFHR